MQQDMIIIAGLGNPGSQYASSRHNVGFMTIDILSRKLSIPLTRLGFHGSYGTGTLGNKRIMLVKPQTFMNESGRCLADLTRYYHLSTEKLLVIYDDIDLPPGKLRIRIKGGAGTHNGMRSIVYQLCSEDFPRIRIGVGMPPDKNMLINWVLGSPSGEEAFAVGSAIDNAALAAISFVEHGLDYAMQQYNR